MGRQFLVLMIGLVFVLVDFGFGRVEVLPNAAGFFLVAVSCHVLSQYTLKFRIGRDLGLVLTGISVVRYFLSGGAAVVLRLVELILSIFLVWLVLAAVIRFAEERERPDLAENGVRYRRIYLLVAAAGFLFRLAGYFEPDAARGFVILVSAGMVFVLFFIVRLISVVCGELC